MSGSQNINQLTAATAVVAGDQLAIWQTSAGDTRKVAASVLATYINGLLSLPVEQIVNLTATDGFSQALSVDDSTSIWLVLDNASAVTGGTVILPLNTGVPDGFVVRISNSIQISSFSVDGNGATINGTVPGTLAANAGLLLKYSDELNEWFVV